MENFDDLMRHKYDNDDPAGRFEFREEYWEQARALIEADEARRRKRRRWVLWLTFSGLMLLSAGVGWWRMTKTNSTAALQQTTNTGQTINTSDEQANKLISSQEQAQALPETIGSSTAANSQKTVENNAKSTETNPSNQTIRYHKKTNNSTAAKQQLSNSDKPYNTKTDNNSRSNPSLNSRETQQKGLEADALSSTQVTLLSIEKTNATLAPTAVPGTVINTTDPAAAAGTAISNASDTDNSSTPADKKLEKLLEQLFTLPLPFPSATSTEVSEQKIPKKAELPMANQIKPVRDQRFTVGVSGAAMAYKASPERRWLGFSSAAYGTYRLNQQWSVSLGIGMRFLPGSWIDSSSQELSDSLIYSFGFKSVSSERTDVGLLSLEIPLAVSWHKKAFGFEIGAAPGRLSYVLERYKEKTESSLEAKKTTKNRLERSAKAPYGNSYLNTFVGAEWHFGRNTSLTMRGNYRFGAIVKATTEKPAIKGGPSLELGLRLKLF